jgi:ubiquinone/menaquinone biosynthesis C-methylase UbiE
MPAQQWLLQRLGAGHASLVLKRRKSALVDAIEQCLPADAGSLLDLGCGDGEIGRQLAERRPGLDVSGVDVLARPTCHIPFTVYDGRTLPFADDAFDYVAVIDVLHHTDDIGATLAECVRVARRGVIVKDHLCENATDHRILRFMDWVGNRSHGVTMTYNYQPKSAWRRLIADAGLQTRSWTERLGLYPAPFNYVFERRLHFLALFQPAG